MNRLKASASSSEISMPKICLKRSRNAQHLHYRRDSELLYADVLYADDLRAGVKSLSEKGSWDNVFAYLGRDIVKSCVQEVGASLVNNN